MGSEQSKHLDINDQQQGAAEKSTEVALPTSDYINDRIFEYGRKLDRWKELDVQSVTMKLTDEEAVQMVRCFRRLQNVLNGYSELRSKILQTENVDVVTRITDEEIFELQKSDIDFLENFTNR